MRLSGLIHQVMRVKLHFLLLKGPKNVCQKTSDQRKKDYVEIRAFSEVFNFYGVKIVLILNTRHTHKNPLEVQVYQKD